MMSDINLNSEENDIETCHRFRKPDVAFKSLFVLPTGKIAIKFLKIKRNLLN